ncbi:MAG: SbcC/MukB-like Walker B domain-containing protein [Verrucomicrobiota bacterium]
MGVYLDEVLHAATQRLLEMSRGRYELQRSLAHKRAGGLELEVMDHHTGVSRSVSTLSGGESFLASLSLALGLSETTQAHAGGVRMDTMFIDEGFGSLDQETLELAFRTLEDLQKTGRLIGIISHVTELRERMETQLQITTTPTGSHAQLVVV